MENPTNAQQNYEKELVYHLHLFLKAMDQYRIWGKRAAASDTLRRDPQFEPGMRQILQIINICEECFRTLPQSSQGGEMAYRILRTMGQVVSLFAENLELLIATADPAKQETLCARLSSESKEMKQCYRLFAELYEQAFPGRLSMVLQSLHYGVASEMR